MKKHKLQICLFALTAILITMPNITKAQDNLWDISIGSGVSYSPKYEGSDETNTQILPYINIKWNDVAFLSPNEGLGLHIHKSEKLNISTSIGYDNGRSEGDDRKNLNGLGDIDSTATANINIKYRLGSITPFIGVKKHLDSSNGLQVKTGIKSMINLSSYKTNNYKINRKTTRGSAIILGLSTEWIDDNYAKSYFGVNSTQSASSGLTEYEASSGFKSAEASIGLLYPINKKWSVLTSIKHSKLIGDIKDSPIVKEENQTSGCMFIQYKF